MPLWAAGITTFFGRGDNHVIRVLREYWNEGGKLQWVAQTQTDGDPIREEALAQLEAWKAETKSKLKLENR